MLVFEFKVLTLLDNNMKPFAETSFALFDEDNQMRQGNQKDRFFAATASMDWGVLGR